MRQYSLSIVQGYGQVQFEYSLGIVGYRLSIGSNYKNGTNIKTNININPLQLNPVDSREKRTFKNLAGGGRSQVCWWCSVRWGLLYRTGSIEHCVWSRTEHLSAGQSLYSQRGIELCRVFLGNEGKMEGFRWVQSGNVVRSNEKICIRILLCKCTVILKRISL